MKRPQIVRPQESIACASLHTTNEVKRGRQQQRETARSTANVKEEESHIKSNWKEPDINHTLCFLFIVCLFCARICRRVTIHMRASSHEKANQVPTNPHNGKMRADFATERQRVERERETRETRVSSRKASILYSFILFMHNSHDVMRKIIIINGRMKGNGNAKNTNPMARRRVARPQNMQKSSEGTKRQRRGRRSICDYSKHRPT